MAFESDYWHTLDNPVAKKLNLDPGTLGISTPPFKDQVESLRTRIFQGASRIELGFTGSGKGNLAQGSTTPEQYGKEERESIRHLAKLNEVQLSTHATFGIGGLSGFSSEEKGFSNVSKGFSGIFSIKLKSMTEKEESHWSFMDAKKKAEDEAKLNLWILYDVFKKAHRMVTW